MRISPRWQEIVAPGGRYLPNLNQCPVASALAAIGGLRGPCMPLVSCTDYGWRVEFANRGFVEIRVCWLVRWSDDRIVPWTAAQD
jgi:hypothetical protein